MLFKRDYRHPFWRGFLHAVAVAMYCLFISMIYLSFGPLYAGVGDVLRVVLNLLFAVVSIIIIGYLVFYEPIKRDIRRHYKAASVMLMSTMGWLIVFCIVFLLGLALTAAA